MQKLNLLLPELSLGDTRPKITNERAYVVSLFCDILIPNHKGKRKLTCGTVAFKMSHLSIPDLYFFFKQCEKGDNFSKVWWGALKDRPITYRPKWKTK